MLPMMSPMMSPMLMTVESHLSFLTGAVIGISVAVAVYICLWTNESAKVEAQQTYLRQQLERLKQQQDEFRAVLNQWIAERNRQITRQTKGGK